jgi:hypothetical protein
MSRQYIQRLVYVPRSRQNLHPHQTISLQQGDESNDKKFTEPAIALFCLVVVCLSYMCHIVSLSSSWSAI